MYYYPGTWDWQHDLKQSLVHKAVERSLTDAGRGLISSRPPRRCWTAMTRGRAPSTTSPRSRSSTTWRAWLPDPGEPERGLLTPNGSGVVYAMQGGPAGGGRRRRVLGRAAPDRRRLAGPGRPGARRGGDRSVLGVGAGLHRHGDRRHDPQRGAHRRAARPARTATVRGCTNRLPSTRAVAAAGRFRSINGSRRGRHGVDARSRFDQRTAGPVRRTHIRRTRSEIAAVGTQLAAEALDMTREPAIYPNPAAHCSVCEFAAPCLALFARRRSGAATWRRTFAGGRRAPSRSHGWAGDLGLRQGRRTAAVEPIVTVLTYISTELLD